MGRGCDLRSRDRPHRKHQRPDHVRSMSEVAFHARPQTLGTSTGSGWVRRVAQELREARRRNGSAAWTAWKSALWCGQAFSKPDGKNAGTRSVPKTSTDY